MSAIAEVLLATGFSVSGSDLSTSPTTARLQSLGAKIFKGHQASNIHGSTCVVISSAVSRENPECVEAEKLNLPVIPRAEMLAELMRLRQGIAIAGSHGKTTTTSMAGQFLRSIDPTVVVGGRLQHWNASSIVGKGEAFIIEADESDRSFLKFSPVFSVVTNIDREHLDTYRDLGDIKKTFLEFLNRTAFFGMNWISADCEHLMSIRSQISKPTKTYGLAENADLHIEKIKFENRKSFFHLTYLGKDLGEFELPVVGLHNIQNATAAIGLGLSLNIDLALLKEEAKKFVPADRRLQIHFENKDLAIVEDYGHHPTEIVATLKALQLLYPKHFKTVLFQPHRFTRTQALWKEFSESFIEGCDELLLLPIYSAHEKPIEGITSQKLAENLKNISVRVLDSTPAVKTLIAEIESKSQPKVFLILGAGPLTQVAIELASHFSQSLSKIDAPRVARQT